MNPFLSVSRFRLSSPEPLALGYLPTATSTMSKVSLVLPASFSRVIFTWGFTISQLLAHVPVLTSMPSSSRPLDMILAASLSMKVKILFSTSTMVTLLPSFVKNVPISRPIAPPPIMHMVFGISFSESISLELSMNLPSNSKPGIWIGLEPVAMMILSVIISSGSSCP